MKESTEGRTFHPGYRIGLVCRMEEHISNESRTLPPNYQMVLIEDGNGMVEVGTQVYPLLSPAVYCYHPQERVRLIAGRPLQYQILCFSPGVLNERLGDLLNAQEEPGQGLTGTDAQDLWLLEPFTERQDGYCGSIPLDPTSARHLAELLLEISKNLRDQPDYHWPCRSRSYLMELLFLVRRSYRRTGFTPAAVPYNVPDSVKPILEYLHTHYREKIKLEDLTSAFHLNKTTLGEQFKRSTGISLIAYVNKIRMTMADSMLRNTLLPTTEIMERIGIRDDAHFIRHFRKYSGYSPAEYRSKYCWMLNNNS
ncbi:AraC family transcriptional regulator [Paenibacillus sp. YPG26]|uniref:helix-turn-helix transcriptional regulator n=1 Tax=Paenibacillus sp. YPG26 TaxID=2878915 RepID=UPI00203E0B33|nr:AraC family transcriptional regulator [Paenibacillus sp. YPG26]USB33964.1 AraC family transcriptional regulator [Paenibacillus sp. YPG26]